MKSLIIIVSIICLSLNPNMGAAQNGDAFVANLNTHSYGTIVSDIAFNETNDVFYLSRNGCYEAKEPIYLHVKWNWISFPRLFRDVNDPNYPDVHYSSVAALTHRIFPEDYFGYDKNEMINLPPNVPNNSNEIISIDWSIDNQVWNPNNGLYFVKSTKGYKIFIGPPNHTHSLFYHGTILDAAQPINVYAGGDKENWVGYFLPETQNPIDALANIWPNLKSVKGEEWAGANMGTEAKPDWVISRPLPLKYGQMLVLETYHDVSFTWHREGSPFDGGTNERAEHFTYDE